LSEGYARKIVSGSVLKMIKKAGSTRYTGRMIFRRGNQSCALFFRSGWVVLAKTNDYDHRLGNILMRTRGLSEETVKEAVNTGKTRNMLMGMVLLEKGSLGPSELYQALVEQVSLIIKSVISWDTGTVFIHDGVSPGSDAVLLRVPLGKIFEEIAAGDGDVAAAEAKKDKAPEEKPPSRDVEEILAFMGEKEALPDDDCYGLLGLKHDVPQKNISTAYHSLLFSWHPDRVSHLLPAEEHHRLQVIFARINTAFTQLGDPKRRKEYDRRERDKVSARDESGRDSHILSGEQLYMNAREAMKEDKYWQAVDYLKKATQLDPTQAKYFYYLGAAYFKGGGNLKQAETALLQAIELDKNQAEYYYSLGLVYQSGKLETRALKMFEKALVWDPTHQGATKNKRLLEKSRGRG
jgi:tetratricopeptide (TPR) repeat protein